MDQIIVDGFDLAFRSHFAHSELRTSSGVYSGCVYGFLVGIRTIKKKFPHGHITIAWDNEATRKKQAYAEYKANRPRMTFSEQIRDLKGIFLNLNVTQAECPGEEADDVIASLAKQYHQETVYIISSDKDLLQLVKNGKVIVIKPKRGANPEVYFDEEAVKKYMRVTPENIVNFLCFRGDTVDNIPGVPMARTKLLVYLIEKYKDIDTIYENIEKEEMTDFQRSSLQSFREHVKINYKLVRLEDNLSLHIKTGTTNPDVFSDYLKKYDIKSIDTDSYIAMLKSESDFSYRKGPAVRSYSLFDN